MPPSEGDEERQGWGGKVFQQQEGHVPEPCGEGREELNSICNNMDESKGHYV